MTLVASPEAVCRACQKPFLRFRTTQSACSPRCALKSVKADKRKEAEETRARRVALKSRAQFAREAQAAVNRYCRLRDLAKGQGCYTCGARPNQAFGHVYDAGHFRSVGSAPHLRFWTPQIRLCCIPCNRHKGGEMLAFRRALVAEHGAEWVEALEARQEVAKFTVDYLVRIKRIFTKKANRLEKRHAMCD
jgi:hypothetical protein